MVAGALGAMVDAVVVGTTSRADARATLVQGTSVATRLSAYIAPSRCVLDANDADFVLWFEDARQSDTVHVQEIRWFDFDADTGTIWVSWVSFPSEWTPAAVDLADAEVPRTADWDALYTAYDTAGHIASMPIAEALSSFAVKVPPGDVQQIHRVCFDVGLTASQGTVTLAPAVTIEAHSEPFS